MGWLWNDDETSDFNGSSNPNGNGDRCATRKVVKSQCHTEEVEPGKFIRKCEKTEQIFKDCVGRPTEMIQSNKEYTEEDVSDQMTKGSFSLDAMDRGDYFPGLRNDIEAIERDFFGGISRFFQAAEEMKNGLFGAVGIPRIYDDDSPSPHRKRGIQIEGPLPKESSPKENSNEHIDLSGLARDV